MSPAESPEAMADEAVTENTEPKAAGPFVYVRHVGRSAANRTERRIRGGNRRQGAVLDNGMRIRKKGRYRLTKIALKGFVDSHERLFYYLDKAILEVIDPATMKALTREDLLVLLQEAAKDFGKKVTVGKELLPPAYTTQAPQSPPSRPEDVTRPDMGQGAVMAAVDQHEAEMTGEANPPVEEEEEPVEEVGSDEGLTEVDLKKMSRKQLDDLAKENDINPEDYSNKSDLIDALLGE